MAKKEPKPWVKDHLDKRRVNWDDLKPNTQDALNAFSKDEIDKLAKLGLEFEVEDIPTNVRVSAVH